MAAAQDFPVESGYEFLVIEDGTADVHHEGAKIGSLGRGDFFGEMAMVAARIRATLEERRAAL